MKRLIALTILTAFFCFSCPSAADETSLYKLSFEWLDQTGSEFKLESLKGKPVILTLAYTNCKTACPLTMQRLKKIDQELAGKVKEPHYVVVSLDPISDTSKKMAEFERQYKLDGKRWHLLTGSESDVRKLSVLLSYSYQRMPELSEGEVKPKEEIVHSNKIVALGKGGEIKAELEGLNSDIKPFASAIADH